MEIPKIANTKGIFEIFIPGTFLIVNMMGVFILFFHSYIDTNLNDQSFLVKFLMNPVFCTIILICFGYLAGIVLRLLRPEMPERWSKFYHNKKYANNDITFFDSEFPYLEWFDYLFKNSNYPEEYKSTFERIWCSGIGISHKKHFFNFYKLLVCFHDKDVAEEIFSAEAVSRYNVGMFYALLISIVLLFITAVTFPLYEFFLYGFFDFHDLYIFIIGFLFFIYLFSFKTIVSNFRLIRIKEVETVIIASLKNEKKLKS